MFLRRKMDLRHLVSVEMEITTVRLTGERKRRWRNWPQRSESLGRVVTGWDTLLRYRCVTGGSQLEGG